MAGSLPSLGFFTARRPSYDTTLSFKVMGEWLRPERLRAEMNKSALRLARNMLIREISIENRIEYLSDDNCEIKVLRSSENSREGAVAIPLIDADSGIVEIVILKGILPYSLRKGHLQPHEIRALREWQRQYQTAVASCNKNNKEEFSSRTSQLRETADTVRDLNQHFMPQPSPSPKVPMFYHMPTLPETVAPEIPIFRPGDIIDEKYEIKGFFQSGGIAALFNAIDIRSGEVVVIKIATEQDISSEIQAIRRLSDGTANKYFVGYRGDGRIDGALRYLALEKIEGESLGNRIARGSLPLDEALDLVLQISQGLMHAAELGITHHDIKPDNIMIREKSGEVVIIDLGLSLRPTGHGKPAGTPDYVSPEQLSDDAPIDHRTDIYSLGLMFYEMLSGAVPFSKGASEIQMIKRRLNGEKLPALENISSDPSVAKMTQKIIAKMAKVNPRRRYRNYKKLIKALDRLKEKVKKPEKQKPKAVKVLPPRPFPALAERVAVPLATPAQMDRLLLYGKGHLVEQLEASLEDRQPAECDENAATEIYYSRVPQPAPTFRLKAIHPETFFEAKTKVYPPNPFVPFQCRVAKPLQNEIDRLRSNGLIELSKQTEEHYERSGTVVFQVPIEEVSEFGRRVAIPIHSEIPKLRSMGRISLAQQTNAYYEEGETRVFSAQSPAIFSLTGEFRPAADTLVDEEADTQVI